MDWEVGGFGVAWGKATISLTVGQHYFTGGDFGWVADLDGAIALLTTGGEAPIPASLVEHRDLVEVAEELVLDLPETGDYELLRSLPRPDDYIAFARRGLYAFDWYDVHRRENRTRAYDLIARPCRPRKLESLPRRLLDAVLIAPRIQVVFRVAVSISRRALTHQTFYDHGSSGNRVGARVTEDRVSP